MLNDRLAAVVEGQAEDVACGFACVDPRNVMNAVREVDRAILELGLRGIVFEPGLLGSKLISFLRRIDEYVVRWAMRKYKRLRGRPTRAWRFLASVAGREPELFAHWQAGARPQADDKSSVS